MSDVTDADRERARQLAEDLIEEASMAAEYPASYGETGRDVATEAIAAALAEERRKAREQFCALLAVSPTLVDEFGDVRGYLVSLALLSTIGIDEQRIRRAAEESGE